MAKKKFWLLRFFISGERHSGFTQGTRNLTDHPAILVKTVRDISSALPEIARLRKSQTRSSSQAFPISRDLSLVSHGGSGLFANRGQSASRLYRIGYRGTRPDITLLMRVSARVPHRPRRSCCPTVCRRCQTFRRVLWGRRLPSHDTALAASRSRT